MTQAGSTQPRLAVRDIAFFERPVSFVRPFRFGAVTISAAAQLFVRVEIELEGKGTSVGATAEMLVPKWFDKRPHLKPEATEAELRRSLGVARELYLTSSGFETAFELNARRIAAQVEACGREDIPPLAAAYGPERLIGCELQPTRYDMDNRDGNKNRHIIVEFGLGNDGTGGAAVSVTPKFGDWGFPATTKAQMLEAVDPLSAIMELTLRAEATPQNPCGGPMRAASGASAGPRGTTHTAIARRGAAPARSPRPPTGRAPARRLWCSG